MSEIIVEILEGILGEPRKHYKDKSQISFDCPVCSYDIKGLEKGDGKGNLEINYESNVYKCWACSETNNCWAILCSNSPRTVCNKMVCCVLAVA